MLFGDHWSTVDNRLDLEGMRVCIFFSDWKKKKIEKKNHEKWMKIFGEVKQNCD